MNFKEMPLQQKALLLSIAFCFFSIMNAFAQIRSNRDLVGKWQSKDTKLEFFRDSKVMMIVPGGTLPVATYTADFMKNPIEIKITLTDNGQEIIYHGRLQFTDNETILIQYSGDNDINNTDKSRTLILKKSR